MGMLFCRHWFLVLQVIWTTNCVTRIQLPEQFIFFQFRACMWALYTYLITLFIVFYEWFANVMRILRSIIIIVGVWFYAIITGFAPPVIRSAAMFSFFAAGEATKPWMVTGLIPWQHRHLLYSM